MRRPILISVSVLVVLVCGILFWFVLGLRAVAKDGESQTVTVTSGTGLRGIATQLKEMKLIRSKDVFLFDVWLQGASQKLKAGVYVLKPSMRATEIVRLLRHGDPSANEVLLQVPEGLTSKQIGALLAAKGMFTQEEWDQAVATTDYHTLLPTKNYSALADKPTTASLEGYLFPDTYRIFKNSTPADVIGKMLDTFQTKVDASLVDSIHSQNKTVFQIVTLGSILEREVKTEQDKKLAADVFWKRISAGIPLQSDATVAYFAQKPINQLTGADFGSDSLYNTYKYRGLPVGPISNPGLVAIRAAVFPESNPYYYFITKDDGSAVFGATLEEHNANKAKYLK